MKYIPLNVPTDVRVPEGYHLILAYAKGDNIVVPIAAIPDDQEDLHNCDWEACGSLDHVVRFNVVEKYHQENTSKPLAPNQPTEPGKYRMTVDVVVWNAGDRSPRLWVAYQPDGTIRNEISLGRVSGITAHFERVEVES